MTLKKLYSSSSATKATKLATLFSRCDLLIGDGTEKLAHP
jgi:hypothetical protein